MVCITLLLVGNYIYRLVAWNPKIPSSSITTIILLDTTLKEEIFFRGYLQKNFIHFFLFSKICTLDKLSTSLYIVWHITFTCVHTYDYLG
ncbi:hypothetical protein Aasi_1576 [Candidatus Amoebophilus asiaticus 5a2]|uniref:Uncharacterized protein n=1 Tax=Amoebophilus asiaticus (strain 5a2) TaxID=452471 RepID=C3L4I6_AMOA5|nr:hypothetical protein Aasi_1576 [Candidatus Amoebophilus asiaticus 5a2]